jgi:hypothetical protein
VVLKVPNSSRIPAVYGTFTPSGRPFQAVPLEMRFVTRSRTCKFARRAFQPPHRLGSQTTQRCRFGLLPFRSPLLRESFLFLGVLRCFSSPGPLLLAYVFSQGYPGFAWVGSPIRVSLDITPAHGLPRAYRSVPRPSSAFSAKASTVCP